MDLSIVTTLYKSAPFICEFYERAVAAAGRVVDDFEIVFVNDGSPDDSLTIAMSIADRDPRVKVIDLSRNFGHHHAVFAGLKEAAGKRVFLLDVDLEEQPEWLDQFWATLEETRSDVVYGIADQRHGSFFKQVSGKLFYKLFNVASEVPIPANVCTVRLMSRRYLGALLSFGESSLFMAGLFAWAGFCQIPLVVSKQRRRGASNYHLLRLTGLFIRAITSFSSYPLWIVFVLGVMLTALSFSAGAYLVVRKLLSPDTVFLGYASMMVSLWFLGGLIISFIGVIGLYLAEIFVEAKRRPQYIIRQTYTVSNSLVRTAGVGRARGDFHEY